MAGEVLFGFPCRQQCEALEQAQFTAMVLSASNPYMYCSVQATAPVT